MPPTPESRSPPARRAATLPLALLAGVAVVAGTVGVWLVVAGPPPAAGPPAVTLALTAPKPAPKAPETAKAAPASPPNTATETSAQPATPAAPSPAATPSPAPANAVPEPPAESASTPPPPPPEPPAAAPGSPSAKAGPQAARTPDTAKAPPAQVAALPPSPPPAPPSYRPPPLTGSGGLAPAPDPALVQKTPNGPLPVVAPDGRRAWQVYARPFDPNDKRPRIAILIAGLGPSSAATETAIQGLPGGVSLAFWPYADNIERWIRLARAAGHEVLLNLPMEPENYPDFDPGPKTLLTSLTPQQNLARLDWALSRVTGYVGVADYLGARFTASRRDVTPVLQALERRGLIFVDSRVTAHSVAPEIAQRIGLPWVASTRFLDEPQISRDAIDARLRELESIARVSHVALGIGAPYPVTLERVAAWADGLADKGFALAPVTAIVAKATATRSAQQGQ